MTANKRIFLNVVATYGRSLYALVIGLFCGRWTLMSLGQVDYGLMGVVGGLVGIVSFLNNLLSSAVGRFYAYSVGQSSVGQHNDVLESRIWFSCAMVMHTAIPTLLLIVGYPLGLWAIRSYLTIPVERVPDCIWVWRWSCLSCYVSMITVPFQAMYTAKQEIAELTIYSFVSSTANVLFLYYMITHPDVWLVKFSVWSCFLGVVPQLIIAVRAVMKYQECRFVTDEIFSFGRYRKLLMFSGSRFLCSLSIMLSTQGVTVLVNKCLGPIRNSAMSIATTVSGNCNALSTALAGSFYPAITNAAGASDRDRMLKLMFACCASSGVAVLLFAVPLILELDYIMKLWLENPPDGVSGICICLLVCAMFDGISDGLWMGIFADGKIGCFSVCESVLWFSVLPIAFVFIKMGLDVAGVGLALCLAKMMAVVLKLLFSRRVCGVSIALWIKKLGMPILLSVAVALSFSLLSRLTMSESFVRLLVTTALFEMIFLPLVWRLVLPDQVKNRVLDKVFGNWIKNNRLFRIWDGT